MYIIDGPVIGSSASQKLELIAVDLLRLLSSLSLSLSPSLFLSLSLLHRVLNAGVPELPGRRHSFRRFILVQRRDQTDHDDDSLDGLLSELILPTDNVEAPFHWYQLVRFANLRSPGFRGSVRSLAEFVHRLTVSRSLQKFPIELSSSFAIAELRASKFLMVLR